MKDGFIKAAAASPALRVADCAYNRDRIIEIIRKAQDRDVKLLVLPELAVTGYTCGDLFGQNALLEGALEALEDIIEATEESDLLLVIGVPLTAEGRLYNCAADMQDGELLGIVPKRNLPNYSEFYEARNFTPGAGQVRS